MIDLSTTESLVLVFISTIMGAFGAFYLKKAGNKGHYLTNINSYLGIFIYCFSTIGIILALKNLDYSIVNPLLSLTYIWTQFIAFFWGKEKITFYQIAGIISIIIGVFLITGTI